MDLTRQPPRRPSNPALAGIVGLARMADKARAAADETIGEFKYGEDSGLDREMLEFIRMDAAAFRRAAADLGDEELAALVQEQAGRTSTEIESFNREHLEREPQDDRHRQLLRERVARYAPDRTDVRTVFASIELDDWGSFRELDLTVAPPRTPHLRTVVGLSGAARMADKARASLSGKLGEYKYGNDSGIDEKILAFLGIPADEFARAAWENPNDAELEEWVRSRIDRTAAQISAFNARIASLGRYQPARERFLRRREEIAPAVVGTDTWFDLIDLDDQQSFGLVDLTRRPPRSPYDTSVGGIAGLARLIDKGRARNGGTLGLYWYGDDSGADRGVLAFLRLKADLFARALTEHPTDEAVAAWLGDKLTKSPEEIEAFNEKIQTVGPTTPEQWESLRHQVARLDPARREISSWYGLMLLDDQITFARLRAGV
ncbi:MAG: DUF5069 domain-containing protein [Candidatus Latescibacterota bacterium]